MGKEKKAFLKHAAVYGIGTLLVQAASVVLVPLYTRYLPPADYGILQILYRVGEIINICLVISGVRMATLTFFGQSKSETGRERIAATVSLFLVIVLVACTLVVTALSGPLSRYLEISQSLLICGVVATTLEAAVVMPLAMMQARVESLQFVITSVAMFVVRVGLTILTVAGLGWGIWGVIASNATTAIVFGVALSLREMIRGSFVPEIGRFKELVRFALPFIPGGLCFMVLHNGDQFFLVGYDENELGIYALAYKLVRAVGMFSVIPLYQVWSARMFRAAEQPDHPILYGRIMTWIMSCYTFVGLGVVLLRHEALTILGSPPYMSATTMVAPLVMAYFFMSASNLMDAAFYVTRKTIYKPLIAAGSAIGILVFYAWLIPIYGGWGAAWATLAGLAIHAALTWIVSQRIMPVRYEYVRLLAIFLSAVAVGYVGDLLDESIAASVVRVLLWFAWPVALWVFGVIKEEEKNHISELVRNGISRLRLPSRTVETTSS